MRDLERDARTRSESLEAQGRLPAGFTAQNYPFTPLEQRELKRLKTAGAAAQDADTYVALAKGRTVDESRLNTTMVNYWRRYG